MPQLKLVENAGSVQFSKNINNFGEQTLANENLKFTLCDLNDYTVRPFGNLFNSFNLPITQIQKNDFFSAYTNTAFSFFNNVDKIVVAEIPQNTYGELIDGKTFYIKIPQIVNSVVDTIDCYATYFLKNESDFNNKVMDSQYSDGNSNSGYFGITPSVSNSNNSNIAYIFSDSIAKPKVGYNYNILSNSSYTLTTSSTIVNRVKYYTNTLNISHNFEVGKKYKISLSNILLYDGTYQNISIKNNSLILTIGSDTVYPLINGNSSLDTNNRAIRSVDYDTINSASTLTLNSKSVENINSIIVKLDVKIEEISIEEGSWSRWTQTNKFIPNLGSTTGKQPAKFSDSTTGLLIDKPIGILYLDKGFAVFTDRNIVDSFYYSGATSGVTTNTDPNFTQIYFNSNLASTTFNSIYSEYVQSVMCIANPNEFYTSNNPTFVEVYGDNGINNTANDPVYITEVGLYNQYGELIAIAKTSEPVPKNKANMVAFNIDLKL